MTLIELLQQQNPDATVVVCDRTDWVLAGLIRPLGLSELSAVQLGVAADDRERWLCEWDERSAGCEDPVPALLLGPR